jgi:hypothetical protein
MFQTTNRPLSEIPIARRDYKVESTDVAAEYDEIVACTPEERDRFLAERPETKSWCWSSCGDLVVGQSPRHRVLPPEQIVRVVSEARGILAPTRTHTLA